MKSLNSDSGRSASEFPSWYSLSAATALYCVPPCVRPMTNFSKHRLKGVSWYSQPFYTGSSGYKLQLKIEANVCYSSANDSHVSIRVRLTNGENDGCLKWPFKGSVTIRLLNWIEDRNHIEFVFSNSSGTDAYLCQSYRKVGERVWPHKEVNSTQFIAHRELEFNANRNTQYMMEDVLCFIISSANVFSGERLTLH